MAEAVTQYFHITASESELTVPKHIMKLKLQWVYSNHPGVEDPY